MDNLWTWKGEYFGYREGDDLRTHDGRHIGRFHGDEVYSSPGEFLGEVRDGCLIVNRQRRNKRKPIFTPSTRRVGIVKRVGYVGYVMIVGFEEFPSPDDIS